MVRNVLFGESLNKADKLNGLFRNRSFNFLEYIFRLFEPFYATNVIKYDIGKHRSIWSFYFGVLGIALRLSVVQVGSKLFISKRNVARTIVRRHG